MNCFIFQKESSLQMLHPTTKTTTSSHSSSHSANSFSYSISSPADSFTIDTAESRVGSVLRPAAATSDELQQKSQSQSTQLPVYYINKNDFRNVVQQLTGPPAYESFSAPPSIHLPKPPSSRLQGIRPPPLQILPIPALQQNQQSFALQQGYSLADMGFGWFTAAVHLPPSLLPFGCFYSPRPLLSSDLLFSPSPFPLSPTFP
ncbi:hypothetical protein JCGZ_10559 [Jatropha curcas]|uniref:VQ domain-containing protein n=1 Tax=Jatropha curcas TaxID=180498 RepID=A0A067KSI4_JATCU|nr:hypothetical protein JCGZ_10559 [Jatropha curcas]